MSFYFSAYALCKMAIYMRYFLIYPFVKRGSLVNTGGGTS